MGRAEAPRGDMFICSDGRQKLHSFTSHIAGLPTPRTAQTNRLETTVQNRMSTTMIVLGWLLTPKTPDARVSNLTLLTGGCKDQDLRNPREEARYRPWVVSADTGWYLLLGMKCPPNTPLPEALQPRRNMRFTSLALFSPRA